MYKILLTIGFLCLTLNTCIDPYVLNLEEYESLLVVEALITDEPVPYTIKLSRTFQNQDTLPDMVTHAEVSVKDDDGNIATFMEEEEGIYKSDPDLFTGKIDETYTLFIRTNDGLEYESNPCLMTRVPEIDSIYFGPGSEFFENGTIEEPGIQLYIDSRNETVNSKYFRWDYEEVWKFRVPYEIGYKYLGDEEVISIPVENYIGWKYRYSKDVFIHSIEQQQTNNIKKKALNFIASARSDRLRVQYSILVKQYSLSKSEYEFWKSIKQVSESGGDIFEKQPYFISGNIHSKNKINEKVLGYFQVSAVKQKRKYITYRDIVDFNLPIYQYPCDLIVDGPIDYEDPEGSQPDPPPTFQELYDKYTGMGYVFVYPQYSDSLPESLERLAFTTRECSDSRATGDPEKPDFWVDLP